MLSLAGDSPSGRVRAVELCLDLYITWLEIALAQLSAAESAHARLAEAQRDGDQPRLGAALNEEFTASLQAVVAAAVAVDAFYAMVRGQITLSEGTVEAWRANGTARWRQIAEVFRRSFVIGPKSTEQMRQHLKSLFEWRDRAVHPSATFEKPAQHDVLEAPCEWHLAAFRSENAKAAVGIALSMIAQAVARPRPEATKLAKYIAGVGRFIDPLVENWEATNGELYERAAPSDGESSSENPPPATG